MTIGEGIAVASFALTVLGLIGGAAWWMGSLYALVRTIKDDLHSYVVRNDSEHQKLWSAIETKQDKHT